MKRVSLLIFALLAFTAANAQKPRPDAFPPVPDTLAPKALNMATTLEEMANWDRYPTYPVYVEMMEHFAETYPDLCHLDSIGLSVQDRQILCLVITGTNDSITNKPEFFYTSTMHGDEVTGFYLMLRLCDSLLRGYGNSTEITRLLDRTKIFINPLSNPDGTYHGGDNTVRGAIRYNSLMVDLNRNYPDPFGTPPLDELQRENSYMIEYTNQHNFRLSANLHGGAEVMNYPWDSYTSRELTHENAEWWKAVGQRFVDTCRTYDNYRFRDVNTRGVINGGDWYVISNGRQDYFNSQGIREITMELSSTKILSTDQLDHYWQCLSHSLINYINEVHSFATCDTIATDTSTVGIDPIADQAYKAYPNPTRGPVTIVTPTETLHYNLSDRPAGIYFIRTKGHTVKVIKQ